MPIFNKPKYSTVTPYKKKDIPRDLYTKCPVSGEIVYTKELEKNLWVVPASGYHFPIGARQRIEITCDAESFEEWDENLVSDDPLEFTGSASYKEKLEKARAKTKLNDAVVSGIGEIGEITVSLAVMDFNFMGGSMGAVVGEKIARAAERALERRHPLIIFSASGGARMYEGIYSLMQMAKTSAALSRLSKAGLPFISVITHPTTGGTTASFATLGDIIIAEPGALICFAGPRVIRETTKEELPEGFQTAEFLLEHGLIDQIVPRTELRQRLISFLHALHAGKPPPPANGKLASNGNSLANGKSTTPPFTVKA